MMINKITHFVDKDYWFKSLDTTNKKTQSVWVVEWKTDFQYVWEPVLIQRIIISFEAILENILNDLLIWN